MKPPANLGDEHFAQLCVLTAKRCAKLGGPLDRGSLNQGRHWIEVVGKALEPEPGGFKGNAPAACRRIQYDSVSFGVCFNPLSITIVWLPTKRPWVSEGGCTQALTCFRCPVYTKSRGNRIPMNPNCMHESFAIRVCRKQRSEHDRPRRHQRAARPPYMEAIWCRKRRHWRSLPDALDPKSRDWQPAFDQPYFAHVPRLMPLANWC